MSRSRLFDGDPALLLLDDPPPAAPAAPPRAPPSAPVRWVDPPRRPEHALPFADDLSEDPLLSAEEANPVYAARSRLGAAAAPAAGAAMPVGVPAAARAAVPTGAAPAALVERPMAARWSPSDSAPEEDAGVFDAGYGAEAPPPLRVSMRAPALEAHRSGGAWDLGADDEADTGGDILEDMAAAPHALDAPPAGSPPPAAAPREPPPAAWWAPPPIDLRGPSRLEEDLSAPVLDEAPVRPHGARAAAPPAPPAVSSEAPHSRLAPTDPLPPESDPPPPRPSPARPVWVLGLVASVALAAFLGGRHLAGGPDPRAARVVGEGSTAAPADAVADAPAAAAPPAGAPVATAAPAPNPAAREARLQDLDTTGLLHIKTDFDATVYVNGRRVGSTPLEPLSLASGMHDVEVIPRGKGRGSARKARARVDGGRLRELVFRARG